MKVLFWLSIGLDRQETSTHLLTAMMERLCEAGHSIHIIQRDTGGDLPAVPERLQRYPVTTTAIPFQKAPKGNFVKRYLKGIGYLRDGKPYVRQDFDAVFIQSTVCSGYAARTARKLLPHANITLNVQDIFPYNAAFSGSIGRNGLVFKIMAAFQRRGYKCCDRIITISEDMKDTLVADGTPADKIEVVYNWSYQDTLYENVDLAPVAGLFEPEHFHVVYAGNVGVMQNVDLLVETARLMADDPTVRFDIIGNGVYKDKLAARAAEYGLNNVAFHPFQPPELAPAVYSAADINVIPLVRDVYRTALPSKTATCLACQKPVIFAIGRESRFGQKVMAEAGCPVVAADRPEELADAIRAIRAEGGANAAGAFFLKYFRQTANSQKYADIITRKG